MRILRVYAIAIAAGVTIVCGGGSSNPNSPSASSGQSSQIDSGPGLAQGTAIFTASPIDINALSQITPIGNLNPPDHTLPTNHSYWFHFAVGTVDVFAPAAGTVENISRGSTDDSIYISPSPGFIYYFGHAVLDSSLTVGSKVSAGQRIGSSRVSGLDLGVENRAVTLFFARPERYINETLHADSALRYFAEPLKSQLLEKVNRSGDDKYGKIDFDQTGRLSGNWYLPDLAVNVTENFGNGPKQLVFARDVNDPSQIRISIGGSLTLTGSYVVQPDAIDPADVTVGTGKVVYSLRFFPGQTPVGLLIAQMLTNDSVKVQTLLPAGALEAEFTAGALTYIR